MICPRTGTVRVIQLQLWPEVWPFASTPAAIPALHASAVEHPLDNGGREVIIALSPGRPVQWASGPVPPCSGGHVNPAPTIAFSWQAIRRALVSARSFLVCAALAPLVACGGGSSSAPATPSATPSAPSTSSVIVNGRTLDVFSAAPQAAVTIRLPSGTSATSAADGAFSITNTTAGQFVTTATGSGVVERQTGLRFPGEEAKLTLIPASFDLATFDQMCRAGSSALRRWDTAPKLVVIDAVLQFTSVSEAAYTATSERLTAQERDAIVADLAWGLPQVTGEAFAGFASVTTESPQEGAQVAFYSREGAIVVARFNGLRSATSYWGYGRWASRSSVVVAGAVMLDRDFEKSGSRYQRSLRVHELGHALGWNHVTLRASFMNNSAVVEPNAFDKDATRLAFVRPPGNESPDRDPSPYAANFRFFPMIWGPITP